MANYDAAAIANLDRLYGTPQIVHQRRRFRAILRPRPGEKGLDIGCGAGRNAVPLARAGFRVNGTDLSWPMIQAAASRDAAGCLRLALAPMDALPILDRSADLIIAHGIWNLARSGAEFRRAVHEAARVAAPHARLFVFTFSRQTLPPDSHPVDGETFVFTRFSGEPQVFLTKEQLIDELRQARFDPDPELPLRVFLGLINEGILLTQRGLGACSLAMTDEDVDRFVNALARVLARG